MSMWECLIAGIYSDPKNILIVPSQHRSRWSQVWPVRNCNVLTVEGVVLRTVVEFRFYTRADFKAKIGRDRKIAAVKKRVYVGPEQHTIIGTVGATFPIRPDMGSLENVQDVRRGNRAAASVCVGHDDSKRPLPQSRKNQLGSPVPRRICS